MMRDKGPDLGQVDPLVNAHRFGRQLRAERRSATRALVGTVILDVIGRRAHHPAVALVPRLGPARLRALPLLLAVGRGRLRGRTRGLLRSLQPQHQLDQLFLAQTLKLAAAHPALESAKTASLKGVGNCTRVPSWTSARVSSKTPI